MWVKTTDLQIWKKSKNQQKSKIIFQLNFLSDLVIKKSDAMCFHKYVEINQRTKMYTKKLLPDWLLGGLIHPDLNNNKLTTKILNIAWLKCSLTNSCLFMMLWKQMDVSLWYLIVLGKREKSLQESPVKLCVIMLQKRASPNAQNKITKT